MASKPQGSSERVLPWQITMDQLIFASISHTHYWYEVGMLKVPPEGCQSCSKHTGVRCTTPPVQYVRCMANHIKAGMLIEKKVHVVHIETINSISTMEKTCMLYILKLICLLQKHEKNIYVVHIKTSMFTTEMQEKTVCCTY